MKAKFKVVHKPAESPGTWFDSKLTLKLVASRRAVLQFERAITILLDSEESALRGGDKKISFVLEENK